LLLLYIEASTRRGRLRGCGRQEKWFKIKVEVEVGVGVGS
jgi:hypothetical protein